MQRDDVLAGAGLGGLVGLIVGLSVSDTVGQLVGALVALIGTVLVVAGKSGERGEGLSALVSPSPTRLFSFGSVCAVALLIGVQLRTSEALSPTPASDLADWKSIGFDDETARGLVVYQRLGLAPAGWQEGERAKETSGAKARVSALFADEATSRCGILEAEDFETPAYRLDAFKTMGAPWDAVAKRAEGADPDAMTRALDAGWAVICAPR